MTESIDAQVRGAAFEFLRTQTALHGEILTHQLLLRGFEFRGQRVPLISPQGIFKPGIMDIPLTFNTTPPKHGAPPPYHDELGADGLIRYRYRGIDPTHRDNVGMRRAMQLGLPLIYLYGIVPGEYLPVWPVHIVWDDEPAMTFHVAVDDRRFVGVEVTGFAEDMQRAYIARVTTFRLHQQSFRRRVLKAYQERCTVCRLKHPELLEAAHILPDGHPLGSPIVANGLSLCKLHHAAFDRYMLGVSPDYRIEIRPDILEEIDGPMLQHGLKEIHGRKLSVLPGTIDLRPRREFLEERFALFRRDH